MAFHADEAMRNLLWQKKFKIFIIFLENLTLTL